MYKSFHHDEQFVLCIDRLLAERCDVDCRSSGFFFETTMFFLSKFQSVPNPDVIIGLSLYSTFVNSKAIILTLTKVGDDLNITYN